MTQEMDRLIEKTIIIAIILGVVVAAYLIWVASQESYSALYLYPDSYTNYVEAGETISFVYGVQSFETERTRYILLIYVGNELRDTKEFWLDREAIHEETQTITLPEEIDFPLKVQLLLEANGNSYDVHFWLKEKSV